MPIASNANPSAFKTIKSNFDQDETRLKHIYVFEVDRQFKRQMRDKNTEFIKVKSNLHKITSQALHA